MFFLSLYIHRHDKNLAVIGLGVREILARAGDDELVHIRTAKGWT